MVETTQTPRWRRLALTAALALLLAGLFLAGMTAQAQAAAALSPAQQDASPAHGGPGEGDHDRASVYGLIVTMPAGSLIGQWTIGERTYTTTAQTEFDQEEGSFAPGVCVKVELSRSARTVVELDSEPVGDCNRGVGDDDDDDDDDNNGVAFRGIVEITPTGTLTGLWTIGGQVYTVTEQTQFRQKYGPVVLGACVKGVLTADGAYVRKLQSTRRAICGGNGGGDDNAIGRGELYAPLVRFPADLTGGEWVVGGLTFAVDANTEFDQRRGAFTVNGYVKVEFVILRDGTFLAKEIKTVGAPRDDDDDDDDAGRGDIARQGVVYATIDSLPAGGGEGVWSVGGVTFTVNLTTELEARSGAFEVGRSVRVRYQVDDAGERSARQIKTLPDSSTPGVFKLVGFVSAMPASGFSGGWTIGGVGLVADDASRFDEDDGMLAPGAFVEVKYELDGAARRIVALETHVMPGGGDHDHIGRLERRGDSLAASADGTQAASWRIGGSEYVVTDATLLGNVAEGDMVLVNSYPDAAGAQVATRISVVTLDNMLFLPAASK